MDASPSAAPSPKTNTLFATGGASVTARATTRAGARPRDGRAFWGREARIAGQDGAPKRRATRETPGLETSRGTPHASRRSSRKSR